MGQLYTALDEIEDVNINYMGLDWATDVIDLVGRNVPLRDDDSYIVPALCWANPSFPLDIREILGTTFDVAIGVVGIGKFVRPGNEGAFLENLVQAVTGGEDGGGVVVVAWRTDAVNVQEEMSKRGATFDKGATVRLRYEIVFPFLKSSFEVYWVK